MIGYIRGVLLQTWGNSCLVQTSGGVGYNLALPSHLFSQLPVPGEDVAFYASMTVREDAQELFGFETFEERQTFEILTSISKIGARTALAILSLYRPSELRKIVFENNIHALTRVSGIGTKTAQHIFLELKYKLDALGAAAMPQAAGASATPLFADSLAALLNLGYAEEQCAPLIREIMEADPALDVGGIIRLALKNLAKRK